MYKNGSLLPQDFKIRLMTLNQKPHPGLNNVCNIECPRSLYETQWGKKKHGKTLVLKGQFTPNSKIHLCPLPCSTIYRSGFFWCELLSFKDTVDPVTQDNPHHPNPGQLDAEGIFSYTISLRRWKT